MREQECRISLDTWGTRTAASPKAGREEADRLLREVEVLGNPAMLRARALAISGSSWRAVGDFPRAHQNFAEASQLYRSLGCPDRQTALDEADLRRRLALLHYSEGKPDLAEAEAREAVVIFRAADAGHLLGLALTALGIAEIELGKSRAIATLSQAASLIDPVISMPSHLAAVHNMVVALTIFQPTAESLEDCVRMINDMRLSARSRRPSRAGQQRQKVRRPQKTLADAMARSLLGRLHNLLGQHEEARRVLESAREDLAELGAPADLALVNLDLAQSLIWISRPRQWVRISILVGEALEISQCTARKEEERKATLSLTNVEESSKLSRRRLQEELEICRRLVLQSRSAAAGQ